MLQFRKSLWLVLMTVFVAVFAPPQNASYAALSSQAALSQNYLTDFHLTPKSLTYQYGQIPLAQFVPAYNYIGGMLLPLSMTADSIGSYIAVNAQEGHAQGWVEKPEQKFELDLPSRLVIIGDQERTIPQGVMTVVGEEIYVDASYLATLLPVNFSVNYDVNAVTLEPQQPLRVFQRLDFVSKYFAEIRARDTAGGINWPEESTSPAAVVQSSATDDNYAPVAAGVEPLLTPSAPSGQTEIAAVPFLAEGDVATEGGRRNPAHRGVKTAESSTTSPPSSAASASPSTPSVATGQDVAQLPVAGLAEQPQDVPPSRPGAVKVDSWSRVVLNTATADQALQAVANPALDENRLLILEPMLDKIRGDYIEVYEHDGGYYLPLGHLMDILEIAIGVDPSTMEASGFYVTEDRTFYLNGRENKAVVGGETITFPPGLIIANPFEIYVDATLLSQLLPTNFELDMAELTLAIKPEDTLPIQARIRREKKWAELAVWKKHNQRARSADRGYPVVRTPYKPATVPFVDVRSSNSYQSNQPEDKLRSRLTVVASGDMGYVNTEAYLDADSSGDDPVQTLRLKAGRSERDGGLLGPLDAKEVYAGDVYSYPVPLVSSAEIGRGVRISNRDLRRASMYDETDFFGDAQPGWEAELYQNNVLIDFQVVGEDGRYEFKNVPIFYGENTFRIVLYGPQGQKREEVREFNIDNEMPDPGEIEYAVSVNERNNSLLGVGQAVDDNSREGLTVIGTAEYGINHRLAANVGVAHVPVDNPYGNSGTFSFVTAGAKASIFGVQTRWDTAYDTDNGGWATRLTGLYRVDGANIRAEQRFYDNFASAEYTRSLLRPLTDEEILNGVTGTRIQSQLVSRSDLQVSKIFNLPKLDRVGTSLGFRHELFEEGQTDTSISGRLSKNFKGTNLSNSLRLRSISGTQNSDGEIVDGAFSIRHRMEDSVLRATARYELLPDIEFTAMNLSYQRQLSDKINGRLDYSQALAQGQDDKRLTGYLNWDLDDFYLSPRFSVDQDAEFIIGVDLLFSLGMDERTREWQMMSQRIARMGAVSAKAFLDENNDGVLNEGESPLAGVSFNGNKNGAVTGEDGVVLLTNFQPHEPYPLRLDMSSLEDYTNTPAMPGYDVITHPGVVTELDYPVIPTIEIDGIAYIELDGEMLEYPGLPLELVNEEGEVIREFRTEYDGYYYVDQVPPGVLTLRVSEKEKETKRLITEDYVIDTAEVRAASNGVGSLRDLDIVVRRKGLSQGGETQIAAAEEGMPRDLGSLGTDEAPTELESSEEPAEAATPLVEKPTPAEAKEITPVIPEEPKPATTLPPRRVPPSEGRRTFVQAGFFCDYKNAERQMETLSVAGYQAQLKGRQYNGQPCYSVQVGPQTDLVEAETVIQDLQNLGIVSPIIVEENAEVYQ